MRIGIVTGEFPPMRGGVGAYTSLLARHLAERHDVHLFSRAGTHSHDGLPVENTVTSWNFGSIRAIARWARANRLQVINLQFQTAAFDMSPWVHFLPDLVRRVPVVTTFHDLRFPYLFPKAGPLRDWIVMHLARTSAGVIVTNYEDEMRVHHLPRTILIPIASNILAPLPANYDANDWRQRTGANPSDLLVGYFGLFNRSKGIDTLLESIAHLRAGGVPARLVFIGGGAGSSDPTNATYATEIAEHIDRLKLADAVHQTGYLDDEAAVGCFLKACDIVALPFRDGASYRRGSLMAAIRYGCPVVTTTPHVEIPQRTQHAVRATR